MTLERVVAHVFRKKGKVTSISEFVFVLSLVLKWFSPDQAELVLANSEKNGLVRIVGDMVEPLFDINSVEIPIDFRPDQSILEGTFEERTVIDRVIEQLSGVKSKKEVIRMINEAQERLGIVETDAVALLVARTCGIDVSGMIDEVYDRLVR